MRKILPLAICLLLVRPAYAQLPENDIRDLQNKANNALRANDLPGAQSFADQSLSTAEKAFGSNSDKMVDPLDFMFRFYMATHQLALAERPLQRIIDIHSHTKGSRDPLVAQDEAQLAQYYANTGRLPQAEKAYRDSIEILDHETFYRTSVLPDILDNFAKVLRADHKDTEAAQIEDKSKSYRANRF
jgi:tetratricopeptide (TPR) repeat protein